MHVVRNRSTHSERIERFLGPDQVARLRHAMMHGGGPGKPWYWKPIYLADVPGNVWIGADGDFHGSLPTFVGCVASGLETLTERARRIWRETGRQAHQPMAAVGFASISDALARASQGFIQYPGGAINKVGPTGVTAVTSTLWRVGNSPAGGAAGAAAPGGTAHTSANTGALGYANPASGTMHLTGADFVASVVNMALLLYDRLFSVAKQMDTTATQAVTGVPTRYQSTTALDADYIGGNFGFIEVGGTALAATAHNWTTCLYTDQANASSTLPSVTGNSAAIVDRLDQPASTWFTPLASGDVGIKAWTQMQMSATVVPGIINFCIGHPLGFMAFPLANLWMPFDWLTNKDQAPRVFDNACLAMLEVTKGAATVTTYNGRIALTNAAP
jgi:hypothetical protein